MIGRSVTRTPTAAATAFAIAAGIASRPISPSPFAPNGPLGSYESANATWIFGSIDANRGDPQNGWDTDQFPNSVEELTLANLEIIRAGGFTTGGFNFDAKLRRQHEELHRRLARQHEAWHRRDDPCGRFDDRGGWSNDRQVAWPWPGNGWPHPDLWDTLARLISPDHW